MYQTLGLIFVRSLIVLGSILTTSPRASALELQNCTLIQPPRSAAVDENHGRYSFVFPRTILKSYNGCQTMWDESGRVLFKLTFKSGELVEYTQNDPRDNKTSAVCRYKDGAFLGDRLPECPTYDVLRNGILTIDAQHELPVPSNRDPRR